VSSTAPVTDKRESFRQLRARVQDSNQSERAVEVRVTQQIPAEAYYYFRAMSLWRDVVSKRDPQSGIDRMKELHGRWSEEVDARVESERRQLAEGFRENLHARCVKGGQNSGKTRSPVDRDRRIHDAKMRGASIATIADDPAIFGEIDQSAQAGADKQLNRRKLVSRVLKNPRP